MANENYTITKEDIQKLTKEQLEQKLAWFKKEKERLELKLKEGKK